MSSATLAYPGGSFGSSTYGGTPVPSANSIECTVAAGRNPAVPFGDDAVPCPEAYDVQITAAAPDSSNTAEQLAHYSQSYLGVKYVLAQPVLGPTIAPALQEQSMRTSAISCPAPPTTRATAI